MFKQTVKQECVKHGVPGLPLAVLVAAVGETELWLSFNYSQSSSPSERCLCCQNNRDCSRS